MSRVVKGMLSIVAILLVIFFVNLVFKDDTREIEKIVHSFHQPLSNIVHIEFLDRNKAIAFYEWGHPNEVSFGEVIVKKGLFGWKFIGGGSSQISDEYKLDWSFLNLELTSFSNYTDLISGKILDSAIQEVRIQTKTENEYDAKIIHYNNLERFWFLITDGEDLLGSTITGLSSDGKIIEQIIR